MRRVVLFSGGMGSYAAAKRVAWRYGTSDLTLLFTDTLMEDADLYRFVVEAAADVYGRRVPCTLLAQAREVPEFHEARESVRKRRLMALREAATESLPGLVWLTEGRSPWSLFEQIGFLGSAYRDPCSMTLKRRQSDDWLKAHCVRDATCVYVGIDWTEQHRLAGIRQRAASKGWWVEAPLVEKPLWDKREVLRLVVEQGLAVPKLYRMGFAHNNCSGFCVKAGHGHFAHLLKVAPDRYAFHEQREQAFRWRHGDVSFLVDRTGLAPGEPRRPLPLRVLRERIEAGKDVDTHDLGGCACFFSETEDSEPVEAVGEAVAEPDRRQRGGAA